MKPQGTRSTLGGMIGQHVIVFLICVAFPGGVTSMAPATWLTFDRTEEGVQCTARTCAFFIVPYMTQRVSNVSVIEHRERAGRTERKRKHGRLADGTVHVDGEGFLVIRGADELAAEVSVSPVSLQNATAKATNFLNSNQPSSMTMFVIANWKFGGLMGGTLTLFTLLYVVGYTLGLLKWILTSCTKMLRT